MKDFDQVDRIGALYQGKCRKVSVLVIFLQDIVLAIQIILNAAEMHLSTASLVPVNQSGHQPYICAYRRDFDVHVMFCFDRAFGGQHESMCFHVLGLMLSSTLAILSVEMAMAMPVIYIRRTNSFPKPDGTSIVLRRVSTTLAVTSEHMQAATFRGLTLSRRHKALNIHSYHMIAALVLIMVMTNGDARWPAGPRLASLLLPGKLDRFTAVHM